MDTSTYTSAHGYVTDYPSNAYSHVCTDDCATAAAGYSTYRYLAFLNGNGEAIYISGGKSDTYPLLVNATDACASSTPSAYFNSHGGK